MDPLYSLSTGDIVVSDNRWLYAIELLGSWSSRRVRWVQHPGSYSHLETLSSLRPLAHLLLRVLQVALLPLTAVAISFKHLWLHRLPDDLDPFERIALEGRSSSPRGRQAIVMMGAPGSGKSLISRKIHESKHFAQYEVIDCDEWKLSTMHLLREAYSKEPPAFAVTEHHYRACELRNSQLREAIEEGRSLIIDGTGSDAEYYEKFLFQQLRAHHYDKIQVIHVWASLATCRQRIEERKAKTGREVPPGVLERSVPAIENNARRWSQDPLLAPHFLSYHNEGKMPLLSKSHQLPVSGQTAG